MYVYIYIPMRGRIKEGNWVKYHSVTTPVVTL